MKVTVLCESLFGNTEEIADQVCVGLAESGIQARVVRVGDAVAGDVLGPDLLVIAMPTNALSLSTPASRADAVRRGASPERAGTGVREWLDQAGTLFAADAPRPPTAVLDTRLRSTRHWPGSAGRRAARRLRRMGFTVVDVQSFYVDAMAGPLSAGEGERAREWGSGLAALATR